MDGGVEQEVLLERERQQTVMSLVNDEAFVFHTEFSEESSGGLKGGPEIDLMWTIRKFALGLVYFRSI